MELKDVLMTVFGMNPKHYYNVRDAYTNDIIAEQVRIDVYWNDCTLYVSLFHKSCERDINDDQIIKQLIDGDLYAEEVK